jgi:hypothetical protein
MARDTGASWRPRATATTSSTVASIGADGAPGRSVMATTSPAAMTGAPHRPSQPGPNASVAASAMARAKDRPSAHRAVGSLASARITTVVRAARPGLVQGRRGRAAPVHVHVQSGAASFAGWSKRKATGQQFLKSITPSE